MTLVEHFVEHRNFRVVVTKALLKKVRKFLYCILREKLFSWKGLYCNNFVGLSPSSRNLIIAMPARARHASENINRLPFKKLSQEMEML